MEKHVAMTNSWYLFLKHNKNIFMLHEKEDNKKHLKRTWRWVNHMQSPYYEIQINWFVVAKQKYIYKIAKYDC